MTMLSGDVAGDHRPARPPVPASAAAARDQVERLLEEHFRGAPRHGAPTVALTDALLVASELVTNAIRHGGGVTGFAARVTGEGLVLTVRDRSPEAPTVRLRTEGHAFPMGGYGWPLVQRLATRIHIAPVREGKTIRVLLPLTPDPSPEPGPSRSR
ncbi:ATP-binding protein [Streptomyces spongiicola]|uniref:ATP-binding protein n=2 Tax=Streptomyces spongiicola TaxID=1690221 RepID=A0A2S1Z6E7_9ACTN|nr:ATP-binding protein [Streptomyces spongiicola]GBP98986.1 ATP-binding protein [Streptomyces spongiicola]